MDGDPEKGSYVWIKISKDEPAERFKVPVLPESMYKERRRTVTQEQHRCRDTAFMDSALPTDLQHVGAHKLGQTRKDPVSNSVSERLQYTRSELLAMQPTAHLTPGAISHLRSLGLGVSEQSMQNRGARGAVGGGAVPRNPNGWMGGVRDREDNAENLRPPVRVNRNPPQDEGPVPRPRRDEGLGDNQRGGGFYRRPNRIPGAQQHLGGPRPHLGGPRPHLGGPRPHLGGPHPHQPGFRPAELNVSFHRLQELQTQEPAEVVAALYYSKEGLSRLLLDERKLTTNDQMMRLLLSCLAKVSLCQSMPRQQNEILNMVRASEFLQFLGTFLTCPTTQAAEVVNILGESADLMRMLITLFPSHVHQVLMVQAFMDIAQKEVKMKGIEVLPEEIGDKLDAYKTAVDAAVEGLQRRRTQNLRQPINEDDLTPPDNFREMSVFPAVEDLDKNKPPFLRKNKQKGGYSNVDHYLDVQFRLLREDFVCPLREGIAEYQEIVGALQAGKRLKDIRVFHDVHILRSVCMTSGLGHRLTFDLTGLGRVRWEVSKRLIYGSLVCLSADEFRTLYFATVSNRDPEDLKKGIVDVTFQHNLQEISAIPPETSFTMAETTAYFEAYRHVLAGLQTMRDQDLPFQNYIVHCQKDVSEPK